MGSFGSVLVLWLAAQWWSKYACWFPCSVLGLLGLGPIGPLTQGPIGPREGYSFEQLPCRDVALLNTFFLSLNFEPLGSIQNTICRTLTWAPPSECSRLSSFWALEKPPPLTLKCQAAKSWGFGDGVTRVPAARERRRAQTWGTTLKETLSDAKFRRLNVGALALQNPLCSDVHWGCYQLSALGYIPLLLLLHLHWLRCSGGLLASLRFVGTGGVRWWPLIWNATVWWNKKWQRVWVFVSHGFLSGGDVFKRHVSDWFPIHFLFFEKAGFT